MGSTPKRGTSNAQDIDASARQDPKETKHRAGSQQPQKAEPRRTATVYDAAAGRIGLNGFLKPEQLVSKKVRPAAPEEVLLRRVNAPDQIPYDYYNADERLESSRRLPDSELLGDIHAYVADYYEGVEQDDRHVSFKSFDETALLALGILLDEACKEGLGENGDMVFSESAGWEGGLPRSRLAQYQVVGRVIPEEVREYQSSTDEDGELGEVPPRKRARRRYGGSEDG